jgi:hypothetical protein
MDPALFEAFNHPIFKSKTVVLNSVKREKGGSGKPMEKKQKLIQSHNFQFL